MLSIGAFSKISGVTPHALRYYDEIGLIKPAHIDQSNGYRYYDTAQLGTILLISKLKSYGLSLEEIAEILRHPDDNAALLSLMKQKRQSAVHALQQLTDTLAQLDQDISNLERGISIMSYLDKIEVQLKETNPQNILFIRKKMSTKDYGKYLTQLYHTVESEKLTVEGAPITVFHIEEEFDPDCYDNEIAIPVKEAAANTRVLPGGPCATVTLHGPYTELPSVYAKLRQWIEQEQYTPVSDAYEVYVTDPNVTAPEENITEIYLPVTK